MKSNTSAAEQKSHTFWVKNNYRGQVSNRATTNDYFNFLLKILSCFCALYTVTNQLITLTSIKEYWHNLKRKKKKYNHFRTCRSV